MSKSVPRSLRLRFALVIAVAFLTFAALAFQMFRARPVQAVSTGVVISQIYGGAGCGTVGCSTYKNDYIELFNRGSSPISLTGWSVQYASATGTTWQVTNLVSFTLQPGQYYLVQEGSGSNGVNNIPTPDASGTIAMSATTGKVALVSSTTALSGVCPSGASIVDLIGYGSTASCFETAVAPAPGTTTADVRNGGGCVETDNNSTDFAAAAPTPRNTASATNPCGTPTPTPTPSPSPPSGVGAANPNSVAAGNSSLLTVTVTPGINPTSTGLAVSADLSSIGGSATQQFFDDGTNGDVTAGNNVFSYNATVSLATTPGAKSLPFTITDAEARSGSGNISLTATSPPVPPGTIVISQLYGGGGNSGATYTNDFIEIFNRSNATVSLAGWSVQYASAAGTSWQTTSLSGTLAPGQYYLVQEAAGTSGDGIGLPSPDATGSINMSANNGKVALASTTTPLGTSSSPNACPLGNANLMDLVGYGTANCVEGAGAAPGLDDVTADFRTHNGCKDTDSNGGNFVAGSPAPRNTSSPTNICPAGDFPPEIFGTSPAANEAHIAQDANITINFDEPVNVSGAWYQISCAGTGIHTAVVTGGPVSFTLNPDSDFGYNEQCTIAVFAAQITDQDVDDPPDNMAADYVFTFNSEFFRDPAEHMVMGNPSNATTDISNSTNFLMMKIQYALSYNDSRGAPNWTSWHLDSTWRGSAPRQDDFRADTTLPPGYHQVQGTDFSGSGFDRGHMCPSADRTSTIADNSATFLMTNMVAQAPDNNQGPWGAYENYLRTFLPGNELYIISGGTGTGGTGSNGSASTIAGGFVNVPAVTWKVALILPVGDDDVSRVDGNTRTIAVIMPNVQGIRSDHWEKYLATVDQVEALSGYDFYSNVPPAVQDVFEAKLDAANDTAPVTSDQNKTTAEDQNVAVTLSATDFNVNNVFTFTIVDQPLHGSVSCVAANCTYSPEAHFFGADQFTYKANDGALDSNLSTIFINVTEVNNDPVAVNDTKQTGEDSSLNFAASDLTGNDSPGPNESGQTLTVVSVISTPGTHGSIGLSVGQITYTPDANYNGPASFDYHVCDDGTTNGSPDSKCTTGTVNITVTEVNDDPTANTDSKSTDEDTALNFAASDLTTNDSTGPANESGQTLTVNNVSATANTHGIVGLNSGTVSYSPAANYNGPASFEYQVCDNGTSNGSADGKCATGTVNVTVNAVNDPPVALNDSYSTNEDTTLNGSSVLANDSDVENDSLTAELVSGTSHGTLTLNTNGTFSYAPVANYNGADSFTYKAKDTSNAMSNLATVSLTINPVNDAPVAGNDSYSTNSNTTLKLPAPGVLSNDTDIDSGTLSSVLVSGPSHGTLTLNADGSFSYSPSLDYTGSDGFSYRAFDGTDYSNAATVSITVNDTVAPTLTSSVAISLLFITNSNLINVGLNASATDNSGGPVTIQVAVFGDEDDQTPTVDDTVHSPDAKDIGPNDTLRLRAERIEANDGRVYLIIVTATDPSGNISRNYHTVVVPKNNKQANIDSVNAQAVAAMSYAQTHAGAPPPDYFVIGDGPIIGPKQ